MKKFFSYMLEEYLVKQYHPTRIRYIGDVMYVELMQNEYAKVEFPPRGEQIHFIRISIINKKRGLIDTCDISFQSVFKGTKKFIDEKEKWNENPTESDFEKLAENVMNYFTMWID